MDDRPLISCIVPVYNGERFLNEALASVFAQRYRPIEVIVVDDGSTDRSAEIVSNYGGRVVYVRQRNAGPASARNHGARIAKGTFVAFLDADDMWHEEKLERQMKRFLARPGLEMVLSYKRNFWEPEMGEEEERLRADNHPFTHDHPGYVCQTLLAPKVLFERVGGFDESLRTGEDTDWYARAEDMGVVREVLPEVLVYRRMHRDNLSYSRYQKGGMDDAFSVVLARLRRKREIRAAEKINFFRGPNAG